MKKRSMRIVGLLLFVCVAFVQNSYSQNFLPKAEAQTAVQAELDALSTSNALRSNDRGVMALTRRYYTTFIEKLQVSSVEEAYNANNAAYENITPAPIADYSDTLPTISANLLTLIQE